MNTKRWFSVLCALILCVSLCAAGFTVSAATPVTFTVTTDKATANAGDTVTVSVNISEKSYLANGTFYLHFDNTAVSYVADSENTGSAAGGGMMFAANGFHEQGYVKIALVTSSSIKKSGSLMTFDFRVTKKAPAAFSFTSDECVGFNDDTGAEFDIAYTSKGCVLNDDGTVTAPVITSAAPVVVTTTTKKNVVTTTKANTAATTASLAKTTTAAQNASVGETTATTSAVTGGATEAQTDAEQTTAPADEIEGETVDTTTTSRFLTKVDEEEDDADSNGLTMAIIIIVIAVVVALGLTGAAFFARKKRMADAPVEDVVDATVEESVDDTPDKNE